MLTLKHLGETHAVLAHVAKLVENHVPAGSVLVAGEGVNQDLDFLGRWRLVDARIMAGNPSPAPSAGLGALSSGPVPILKNVEAAEKFEGLTGHARFALFAQEVWRWVGGRHRVYLLLDSGHADLFKAQLSADEEALKVEELRLPDWRGRFFVPPPSSASRPAPTPGQPPEAMQPDRIFDLPLHGQSLLLLEWKQKP